MLLIETHLLAQAKEKFVDDRFQLCVTANYRQLEAWSMQNNVNARSIMSLS
jgi:hypothetical protein